MSSIQETEWQLIEHLPFTTDDGVSQLAKIGLVVLSSDYTIEHEFRRVIAKPGVECFHTRVENSPEVTPETLAAMKEKIPAALKCILPGDTLDVVAYGCTSATTVLGEQTIFDLVRSVQPNARVTTPITAAFAAFNALSAKRIAVLTPYRSDVNTAVRSYIVNAGYEVPVFGSFNESMDPVVAKIDAKSIAAGIDTITRDCDVDMVFVSCTSVRLVDEIASLEDRFNLPVTSSNHAMAWHCLRLAGVSDNLPQWGKLYQCASG